MFSRTTVRARQSAAFLLLATPVAATCTGPAALPRAAAQATLTEQDRAAFDFLFSGGEYRAVQEAWRNS